MVLLLASFFFGACTKEVPNGALAGGEGETTSMRFEVRVAVDDTPRAVTQDNEAGTEDERSVSSMAVLFDNLPYKVFASGLVNNPPAVATPVFELVAKDAVRATRLTTLLNAADPSSFSLNKNETIMLSDFDKLVNTTGGVGAFKDFLMTATVEDPKNSVAIKPDVTKVKAEQGGPDSNNFAYDVERVLSRAQVRKADPFVLSDDVAADKGTLHVNELKYALAGSAKEVYLYRDYAGATAKMDNTTAEYAGKTFVDDKTVPSTWKGTEAHPFLQRLSDYAGKTGAEADNFSAKSIPTGTPAAKDVIYFLENSTAKQITGRGQLEYNRIAYVKIYGTFTPAKGYGYSYDAGTGQQSFPEVTSFPGGHYLIPVPKNTYDWLKKTVGTTTDRQDPNADMKLYVDGSNYFLVVDDPQGTFYLGKQTDRIYSRLDAALFDGNTRVTRYYGGKMVWLNPVNAQIVGSDNDTYVKNADTRRNNIYDLTIDGIAGFGLPFDPIDPKDPNIPDHESPFAPEPDPHIYVDPLNSKILINASVLDWNVSEMHFTF